MTSFEEDFPTSTFQIYPNPAHFELYLKGIDLNHQTDWVAVDASGRRIALVGQPNGDVVRLDVSNLPDGLYVLEYVSRQGLGRLKFVKR
jgi:hypothetical protein